jgi:hypothetical protein
MNTCLPVIIASFLTSLALAVEPATPNPGLHYYCEVPKASLPQVIRVDICVLADGQKLEWTAEKTTP